MTLQASVGTAQALDGREAGLQAAHQALNRLGVGTPALGILICSHHYAARDVVTGVSSLLGDAPLIGFSTPSTLAEGASQTHTVTLALLSGDFQAESHWFPGYAQSGRETAARLAQLALGNQANHSVIFFADGFNGDAEQLCTASQISQLQVVGGLSSGDLHTGATYQIAGNQSGSSSLAAGFLRGNIRLGIGYAHGWDPVGSQFRITRSRGFWLRTLNGRPASETYAELFGQPARDWAFPPLSYLARLYPLGIEQGEDLIVRAPIRVEADGSFRMNAAVRDGADAFLLVGSRASCEKAATQAAQQALLALGSAKPAFVLMLVDIAWQMLLKSKPGAELAAVRDVIGADVPVAGGYTLGQVIPGQEAASPKFLNQHIVVVAFGEAK
ncbi:MAG TPA: FIST N-terminal domain-containing protein [Anaerolineales bacterium]|nr:FIST N-terminal domain-containing protein [Anaerolineales bacterium]